ncbi:hypothetical protein RJT34_14781 [Clitoria ternatea]|uniref:RING-type domain-containing protein n=1 Tax=Clitoria ternatea TaxID=43366 RepID=A0AAN9JUK2_CLITE
MFLIPESHSVCFSLCSWSQHYVTMCVPMCQPLHWIASRRLNSGLKKTEMVALPTSTYYSGSPSSSSPSNCAICLAEFSDGNTLRSLPNCNHNFHVDCIDKWLLAHSSCPTCRNLLKSNDSLSLHINVMS